MESINSRFHQECFNAKFYENDSSEVNYAYGIAAFIRKQLLMEMKSPIINRLSGARTARVG